jgi:hypothetical protein
MFDDTSEAMERFDPKKERIVREKEDVVKFPAEDLSVQQVRLLDEATAESAEIVAEADVDFHLPDGTYSAKAVLRFLTWPEVPEQRMEEVVQNRATFTFPPGKGIPMPPRPGTKEEKRILTMTSSGGTLEEAVEAAHQQVISLRRERGGPDWSPKAEE